METVELPEIVIRDVVLDGATIETTASFWAGLLPLGAAVLGSLITYWGQKELQKKAEKKAEERSRNEALGAAVNDVMSVLAPGDSPIPEDLDLRTSCPRDVEHWDSTKFKVATSRMLPLLNRRDDFRQVVAEIDRALSGHLFPDNIDPKEAPSLITRPEEYFQMRLAEHRSLRAMLMGEFNVLAHHPDEHEPIHRMEDAIAVARAWVTGIAPAYGQFPKDPRTG
ncbi:hypothetical protein [Nesterenkonia rhizosphaerae]|uniref:DUF4129 domain-containing protein n=1 Tax=Nesterenkonia rhizosphaerae TaxID=1348272 RepID=A0ABP9G886_9MICC